MTLKQWDQNAYADELEIWAEWYDRHPFPDEVWLNARTNRFILNSVGVKEISDDDLMPRLKKPESPVLTKARAQLAEDVRKYRANKHT